MKIALCQIDSVVADFYGNSKKILAFSVRAEKAGAELAIFPELCICAYPPLDLLADRHFIAKEAEAFKDLSEKLPPSLHIVIGHLGSIQHGDKLELTNRLSVIHNKSIVFSCDKKLLKNYGFFNEYSWFSPGKTDSSWVYNNKRITFIQEEELPAASHEKCDLFIAIANSVYEIDKLAKRVDLAKNLAEQSSMGLIYCNSAGAQDSIVFDGRSFFINNKGELDTLAKFEEDLIIIDADKPQSGLKATVPNQMDELEKAIIMGIKDYMHKCGFKKAHLGLSGGLDSAIVAVLAVKAIGAENLCCISMPSRFSSAGSVDDSVILAKNLGCQLEKISIESPFSSFLSLFEPFFKGMPFNITEENLQARIRGNILMAWSNKFDSMLLTTSNKSEFALGYSTLYGDMCGSLAPIADLLKTEVYALSEHIYAKEGLIPRSIIDKAPSAELRPNQRDEDSLPPYKLLDPILRLYLEEGLNTEEIIDRGFEQAVVQRVISLTIRSEYKRRQAALLIKLSKSPMAGPGRAMPLARK